MSSAPDTRPLSLEMGLEVRGGNTELVGRVEDQAELQGVLVTVTGLGLSLVSVTPLGE